MKLRERLKKIAESVKSESKLADIGTDHAALPIYLIENLIVKTCIATENRPGPLKAAVSAVHRAGLADKIQIRLGSGLKPLALGEVDTVVIAGMGGLTIIDILEQSPEIAASVSTFILQPMVAQPELRRYLLNNDYRIITEKLAFEDGKFYELIVSDHGTMHIPDEIYYETGIQLVEQRDPLFLEFVNDKIEKTKKIIYSIENNSLNHGKIKKLEAKLQGYLEVKQCWQNAQP